jgi:hypothetical protein
MTYGCWTLLRSLSFTCISRSALSAQQLALGLLLLLTLTMLLESILKPRATRTMSLLDRFGELVISIVICRGTLYSGDERLVACYRGVVTQPDLRYVWFARRSC